MEWYEVFYAYIAANYKNGELKFDTSAPENSFTSVPTPYGIYFRVLFKVFSLYIDAEV
ncbi:hypothetical protein K220099C10_34520 [Bacteroides thetaiotaomicron]